MHLGVDLVAVVVLERFRPNRVADVVHQHVDPAPVTYGGLHGGGAALPGLEVDRDRLRVAIGIADGGHDLVPGG